MEPQVPEWWLWLAYALFSRHTDHAISSVRIDRTFLTMADVHSIREMLLHDNPLALLYQTAAEPPVSQWPLCTANLHESAVAFLGHHEICVQELDRQSIQLDGVAVSCQVVRDCAGEDFIEVVEPGIGACWLNRSDVVEVKPLVRRDAHPIRELNINSGRFGGEAAQLLIELLQMIGGPLEQLDLSHDEDLVDNHFCNSMLASCFNLTHLNLQWMQLESLDWLVDVPATCKLATLDLCLVDRVAQDPASWSRLFSALSDESPSLTKSLRRLRISLRRRELGDAQDEAEEDAICQNFVEMLAKNRLLQHCELVSCSPQAGAAYKMSFMAHHDEPLNEAENPLQMGQKLAFLNMISDIQELLSPPNQPKKTPDSFAIRTSVVPAWTGLTPDIVAMVFTLAATPKRRVCHITAPWA